ncbi:hypothetical protein TIFTF001_034839 [Ficus carica]|uniref:Uncharacterized protein n=1 Tax=Ficus carica TaxID=3494 RepID=A0AA88J9C2_FICCA|nr:hypothetical protein TIFTF001_034831 [Ficus carica]GMN65780.1 hypothetical protein TIFTF001_034839 [Ficus carica]
MNLRSRKTQNRSRDWRIDLTRLSRFLWLFSTGLATSSALSLRFTVARRQSPMGELRTSEIAKKIVKNRKENHCKSRGKSDHDRPFSLLWTQDLQPHRTGFSEHVVFSSDDHLCGRFGGLGIWIWGLF